MSEKFFLSLLAYYFYFFYMKGISMTDKICGKVMKFFTAVGVVAGAIYYSMNVLELLTEWYETGVLLRVWKFISETLLFWAYIFIIWILHRLGMFALHKLWPDTFDEYGHMK